MVEINLGGRVALVTGGASGVGRAIAGKLARAGARVMVADIDQGEWTRSAGELGEQAAFVRADVSRRTEIDRMVEETLKRFGALDILVNNAGILIPRLLADPCGIEEATEEVWDRTVTVNQKGAFFAAQAAARVMIARGRGVILNVTSESGLEGSEGQSIYAGTKAALYSYTRSWAKELGRHGIRVVGIAPGILEATGLRSPEYERALAYTRGISVDQLRQSYEKVSIPLGRPGTLEETAAVACFLVSDLASYITGTVVNISGGKSRG